MSNLGVRGTVPLSLSRGYDLLARMLGYNGWHDMCAAEDGLVAPDHAVEADERAARHASQAGALAAAGFSEAAAAAMVEIVLPTGDAAYETRAATAFVDSHVRSLDRLPPADEIDAAWMLHRLGLPESRRGWALRAARVRASLDGGLASVARKENERFAEKTAHSHGGYFAVVAEPRCFYQGYFLVDPGPEIVGICDRAVAEILQQGEPAERMLKALEGMIETGFTALPGMRSGALQAGVIECAMSSPPQMAKVAGFSTLLARETGFRHFVVRLDRILPGGISTSVHALDASDVAEARAAIEALPEVARIKRALAAKPGFPPGMAL
jgi:hypothetical protein